MSNDPLPALVSSFLLSSRSSIDALVKEVSVCDEVKRDRVTLYDQVDTNRRELTFDGKRFFLRTSFEYSSPQATLEELQGMIAARLLEVSANHVLETDARVMDHKDIETMAEMLRKPPCGKVIPFSLQTDDIEPDRYSNNPLRKSIVESGQSAFPVSSVSTKGLAFDQDFLEKYRGSLVTENEFQLGRQCLNHFERYVDFVDYCKTQQLQKTSEELGICLRIPTLRMPLETLKQEKNSGPMHSIIQGSHSGYETIEEIYKLMGRNIKKKTLLLTVPHSTKGFGSKRCTRGKIIFTGQSFSQVKVNYETTRLYPNMADPNDVSTAFAEDSLELPAERFTGFSYIETPASPQFALYALLSPEDSSLWHGVGAFSGSDILKSYSSVQSAFLTNRILKEVPRPKICQAPAMAFNLTPDKMWTHPTYGNIDASLGCIPDLKALFSREIKVTCLNLKRVTDAN